MLITENTVQYAANSNTSKLFKRPFFYFTQKQRLKPSIKFSCCFDIEGTDKPITDEEITIILKYSENQKSHTNIGTEENEKG